MKYQAISLMNNELFRVGPPGGKELFFFSARVTAHLDFWCLQTDSVNLMDLKTLFFHLSVRFSFKTRPIPVNTFPSFVKNQLQARPTVFFLSSSLNRLKNSFDNFYKKKLKKKFSYTIHKLQ